MSVCNLGGLEGLKIETQESGRQRECVIFLRNHEDKRNSQLTGSSKASFKGN